MNYERTSEIKVRSNEIAVKWNHSQRVLLKWHEQTNVKSKPSPNRDSTGNFGDFRQKSTFQFVTSPHSLPFQKVVQTKFFFFPHLLREKCRWKDTRELLAPKDFTFEQFPFLSDKRSRQSQNNLQNFSLYSSELRAGSVWPSTKSTRVVMCSSNWNARLKGNWSLVRRLFTSFAVRAIVFYRNQPHSHTSRVKLIIGVDF